MAVVVVDGAAKPVVSAATVEAKKAAAGVGVVDVVAVVASVAVGVKLALGPTSKLGSALAAVVVVRMLEDEPGSGPELATSDRGASGVCVCESSKEGSGRVGGGVAAEESSWSRGLVVARGE